MTATAKNKFVLDPKRPHKIYVIAEFTKGNKKTTYTAIRYYDENAVYELRKVETLKSGKVVETQETSRYLSPARVYREIENGKVVYGITEGGATWHSRQ